MESRDELDGALFEAFRREAGESALAAIERPDGALAGGGSAFLKEPGAEAGRVRLQRQDSELPKDARFRVLGELTPAASASSTRRMTRT